MCSLTASCLIRAKPAYCLPGFPVSRHSLPLPSQSANKTKFCPNSCRDKQNACPCMNPSPLPFPLLPKPCPFHCAGKAMSSRLLGPQEFEFLISLTSLSHRGWQNGLSTALEPPHSPKFFSPPKGLPTPKISLTTGSRSPISPQRMSPNFTQTWYDVPNGNPGRGTWDKKSQIPAGTWEDFSRDRNPVVPGYPSHGGSLRCETPPLKNVSHFVPGYGIPGSKGSHARGVGSLDPTLYPSKSRRVI
jgi:hypothetical protein